MKRIAILILILFATPVWGATYYLNSNGSNTSPYDTWAKGATSIASLMALDPANGAHTVYIRAGDTFSDETFDPSTEWTNDLTTLTIEGADGDTRTLASDGNPEIGNGAVKPFLFDYIAPAGGGTLTNLVLKNVKMTGQDWDTTNQHFLRIRGLTDVTIENVQIDGEGAGGGDVYAKEGIWFNNVDGDITITDVTIERLCDATCNQTQDVYSIYFSTCDGTVTIDNLACNRVEGDCIQAKESTAVFDIRNSTFYNCAEECIDMKGCDGSGNGTPNKIRNNTFYETSFTAAYQTDEAIQMLPCSVSGDNCTVDTDTANWDIYENYIYNLDGVGSDASSRGVEVQAARDTAVCEDIRIFRNKFKNLEGAAVALRNGAVNVIVENNVMLPSDTDNTEGHIYVGTDNQDESGKDTEIRNNSIYDTNDTYGIFIANTYGNYVRIANNAVHIANVSGYALYHEDLTSPQGTAEENHWWNPLGTEIYWDGTNHTSTATWVAAGHTDGEIEDPQFNAVGSDDLSINSGGNLVDRGGGSYIATDGLRFDSSWTSTVITVDPTSTRDRGAYEYSGSLLMFEGMSID
jgi:hypothetical protein